MSEKKDKTKMKVTFLSLPTPGRFLPSCFYKREEFRECDHSGRPKGWDTGMAMYDESTLTVEFPLQT